MFPSASSMSSSHFSFLFINFWRDVWISFRFCRTLYHYKIQVKFDIGNHPPNFSWVMALFQLSFCCSFQRNKFLRDALISFRLRGTLYQCKIQVKFDSGNHSPNFGWVMALFRLSFCWFVDIGFWSITFAGMHCFCWFVDIGFWSITFAGMHWFYWKFAEGYIIAKYRTGSLLVIIRKVLAELCPFFDLVFVGVLILVSDQ